MRVNQSCTLKNHTSLYYELENWKCFLHFLGLFLLACSQVEVLTEEELVQVRVITVVLFMLLLNWSFEFVNLIDAIRLFF